MTEIEIYLKNLSDIQSIKSEYPKYNEVELDNYDSMINSVEIFYPRNTIEKNEQKKLISDIRKLQELIKAHMEMSGYLYLKEIPSNIFKKMQNQFNKIDNLALEVNERKYKLLNKYD